MFKDKSLMISLYLLSGITGVGYLLLLLGSLVHLIRNSSLSGFEKSYSLIVNNLILIGEALVLSLPFALVITFLVVSNINKKPADLLRRAVLWIDQAPILLFGLFFLAVIGPKIISLLLAYFMIAVVKISKRWIKLSLTVTSLELEAAVSLGMSLWQLLFTIYIKRLIIYYSAHFIAVACLLFTLFTPFIVFYTYESVSSHLISLELFRRLGQDPSQTATIVFLILLGHLLKVIFDSMAVPKKVEHG